MKRTISILLAMLMTLAMLSGCAEEIPETPTEPQPSESLVWETMPKLTYGVMEYEKLKVEPWYCGRAEATGANLWAETKDGFYHSPIVYSGSLIFTDKGEQLNWVHVCTKPDCTHPEKSFSCEAYLGFGNFYLHNGRIFFPSDIGAFRHLASADGHTTALFSKALNGTDVRLEKQIEDAIILDAGEQTSLIVGSNWISNLERLNPDGSYTGLSFCYNLLDESLSTLFCETYPDPNDFNSLLDPSELYGVLFGDRTVVNNFFGTDYQRVVSGKMELTGAKDYATVGDYLSGSILRQFRSNEGYYDINLGTGEEVHLADAQLKNSQSFIVLPNCIIETTLGSENHQEGEAHAMMLFDGESWRTVTLPEELTQIYSLDMPFEIGVVTSDRIIILVYNNWRYSRCSMYQIMLGENELTMEFCCELG